jgi:hypothetical protein
VASRPAYIPTEYLVDPAAWVTQEPAWRDPTSLEERRLTAAVQLQHRLSRRVLRQLRARDETIADLAARLGQGEDQLWRKLAGRAPAQLGDLTLWALITEDEPTLAAIGVAASTPAELAEVWPSQ